jgi:hypothetical protein
MARQWSNGEGFIGNSIARGGFAVVHGLFT